MKNIVRAIALTLCAGSVCAAPIAGTDGMGAPTVAGQTGLGFAGMTAFRRRRTASK